MTFTKPEQPQPSNQPYQKKVPSFLQNKSNTTSRSILKKKLDVMSKFKTLNDDGSDAQKVEFKEEIKEEIVVGDEEEKQEARPANMKL